MIKLDFPTLGKKVYFWYKGYRSNQDAEYEIHKGTIQHWTMYDNKQIANIQASYSDTRRRTYGGFSIQLPNERLFDNEAECRADMRDKIINELLDE